jgi:hypothetical protein
VVSSQPLGGIAHISNAISNAILQITGQEEFMVDMEQLWLPTMKCRLGIHHLISLDGIVCKAGFLPAAALAQQELAKAAAQGSKVSAVPANCRAVLTRQFASTCTG